MPLARAMVGLLPKARKDKPKSVAIRKEISRIIPTVARVNPTAH